MMGYIVVILLHQEQRPSVNNWTPSKIACTLVSALGRGQEANSDRQQRPKQLESHPVQIKELQLTCF